MSTAPTGPRQVLILTPTFHGHDGISSVARGMTKAVAGADQAPDGLAVWSLCDKDESRTGPPWNGVRFLYGNGSKKQFVAAGLKHALRQRFDLVVVNHLALLPIARFARKRRGKVAAFLHGVECWRPLDRLRTWCLRTSDHRIANSHFTWDQTIANNKRLKEISCSICPLGVSLRSEAGGERPRPADWPKRYALIVGRISSEDRYKGHDPLIDLWPRLIQDVPDASLLIAGDGDDRPRLQTKVNRAGLRDHIHFLGRVSDETLDLLYQHAELFVMPSSGEGFGLVFLEAMRSGVACIGGVGAPGEIIKHGETGFLVDPASRDELLVALTTLFQCPARARKMGEAGRVLFEKTFTDKHFQTRLRQALGFHN